MSARKWIDQWNDIIRYVIFADEELRSLMMIPQGTSIIQFIDRYFIRAGYTSKTLKNEPVRIIYGELANEATHVPNITKPTMSFDIYVKMEDLHNVGDDRLVYRTQLIANRLIELLTTSRYTKAHLFSPTGQGDMGSRTIGYARYVVTFDYVKVY